MTRDPSIDNSRRLFAGDFPELQDRFVAEVAEQRRADPLAPLKVLVPGHLAGLYLKRQLARAGTSHANLRFGTLTDFARELAEPLLAERQLRMLPEMARGPLMKRAVESCGTLRYFSRMAGRAGFRQAAWSTIHELRDAMLAPEDLEFAAKHRHTDDILRAKLSDLALIWRALNRLMEKHRFADRAGLIELASERAGASFRDPESEDGFRITAMMTYGLDDLTAIERRLLEIAMRDIPVTAFLPFRASDAYAWAEPLYLWYLDQGFETELLEPEDRAERADTLTRLQLGVFETDPPPFTGGQGGEGARAEDDQSFLLISAPSRDSEVEEIVREVLYSPENASPKTHSKQRTGAEILQPEDGLQDDKLEGNGGDSDSSLIPDPSSPSRSAVLMRESDNYLTLFREEFGRAGITGYFQERRCLGETPPGRALRGLAKLLDGEFRRADVMEFMLSSPLKRPADFPADLPEVPVSEWNHFAQQAQIVAGERSWKENLTRLRHRLTHELERREWEMDDPTAPLQRQLTSLTALERYVERLFAGIRGVREAKSWKQLGESMASLFAEYVDADLEAEAIRADLSRAELLDQLGLKPDLAEFPSLLESVLAESIDREGRFEIHEPAVAKISEALGVIFDQVFLCGMVEKEFPRHAAQDPLLLDDERRQVQSALFPSHPDVEIPLRSRRHLREQFLFRVALNSARKRIVLSYPRMDPFAGREWLASAFLLRAVEAATGENADYESLETFTRTHRQARRVSLSRLRERNAERAVTPFQYDLAVLGSALRAGTPEEAAYLFGSDEFFKRAVASERARYRERNFTSYDGYIENAALRLRLPEWVPQLSPSRMDTYANCPYQYFALHLLELEPSAEPQWIQPLDPRVRGILLHEILEKFLRGERDAGTLPLREDAWPRLEQAARDSFADFERTQVPGLFLLWDIERSQLLRRLRAFLNSETETPDGFTPRYFNVGYGLRDGESELSRVEPVAVKLEGGYILQLRGKLDRVDVNAKGQARLVDYTTRDFDKFHKMHPTPTVQSHAARLAAEALGLKVESFVYYFLATDGMQSLSFSREDAAQSRDGIMRRMEFISQSVAGGAFYPHPSESCRFCEARSACGSGRFTRKWEFGTPQVEEFRVLYGGEE